MVATALALGVSELVAGGVPRVPSLLYAIGGAVIELGAGTPVKDIAIALFGTNEKTALVIGTVILSLLVGAGLGVLGRRRGLPPALLGFALFGLLGILATTVSPLESTGWAVPPALLAVATGVLVLRFLLGLDARVQVAAGRAVNDD
ncbi:MAG TPA: hypothetical protein VMM13_18160, partial [Euzebya sp.]|nr:hypothetical protein [Euzebya sp.]